MTTQEYIKELLAKATAAGFSAAEVRFTEQESFSVRVLEQEIENYAVNKTRTLSFRGLYNGKMGTATSEALDASAMVMLIDAALESAKLIEDESAQFIFAGSPKYEAVNIFNPALEEVSPQEKIEFAMAMERYAKACDPRVVQLQGCGVTSGVNTEIIANTTGLFLVEKSNMISAMVVPVVREGALAGNERAFAISRNFATMDAQKLAEKAVRKTIRGLGGTPVPSAQVPIVLEADVAASLLASFTSIFSADTAQKGRSLFKGKEGEQVAAPLVTLLDDPLMHDGFRSRSFDSEGVAVQVKKVIEGGKLTTLLHNLKTAAIAGVASTGNATAGGRQDIAPFNFMLMPAEGSSSQTLEQLYAGVGEGVLITRFDGMNAGINPDSGDFSLSSKGVRIEGGKLTTAVAQITVAGNFYSLLQNIVAMGDDLTFTPPMFAYVGSPSLHVQGLSIAGG